MTEQPLNETELAALRAWDTPTICNALEIVAPERRAIGFDRFLDGALHPYQADAELIFQ